MKNLKHFFVLGAIAIVLTLIPLITTPAAAQTETVLHTFAGSDGISPLLGVTFDSTGNLYGVTAEGGTSNNGTVFELSPKANGTWTVKTLISFDGGTGGSQPVGGVIINSAGTLYGTTKLGGSNGVGVVYKLVKSGSGAWTETVLHNFGGGKDGQYPTHNLVLDAAGNLYGTTEGGGAFANSTENSGGTAYKLSPNSSGGWTETVIHSFGNGTDGAVPQCTLMLDSAGNVYGTTMLGGASSGGTVFEISPQSGGGWKEKILYSFDSSNFNDGLRPVAGVIFDKAGNLFGTTTISGELGGGTVFELSPSGSSWTETILASFEQPFFKPSAPDSELVSDASGNLYGTTRRGAGTSTLYDGDVFQLKSNGNGTWNLITYFAFGGNQGAVPAVGSLSIDSAGNLYGGTQAGGSNKDGVVFKIVP